MAAVNFKQKNGPPPKSRPTPRPWRRPADSALFGTDLVLETAATVIAKASREQQADSILRETLRATQGLASGEYAEVARAVFSHYRWFGWLDAGLATRARVEQALALADAFAARPQDFNDGELRSRAVPNWVKTEMDVTTDWARAMQAEPRLWLRARHGKGAELARKLRGAKLTGLADALIYEGQEDLFHSPLFHAGEFEIQDIASQAVGWLCAPKAGETWWDICAGEGGKLLHLSDLMNNQGLIWASDRAEWRLRKLKRRAARARCFNYRAVLWDGGEKLPMKTKFDGILIDAPCSGLGTWQRNPHARWTTTSQDVAELAQTQAQLLSRAATALKPGGRLVYSVCTLTRSETSAVAEAVSAHVPSLAELPLINPWRPAELPKPQLWLWPQETSGNGMFVAAWTKEK